MTVPCRRRELRDPRARAEERVAGRLARGVRREPQPSVLPDRLEHAVVVRVDPRLPRARPAFGGCDANGGRERRVIDGVAISVDAHRRRRDPVRPRRDGRRATTARSPRRRTPSRRRERLHGRDAREVGVRARASSKSGFVEPPSSSCLFTTQSSLPIAGPPLSLQLAKMSAARTTIPSATPRRGWSAQPGARYEVTVQPAVGSAARRDREHDAARVEVGDRREPAPAQRVVDDPRIGQPVAAGPEERRERLRLEDLRPARSRSATCARRGSPSRRRSPGLRRPARRAARSRRTRSRRARRASASPSRQGRPPPLRPSLRRRVRRAPARTSRRGRAGRSRRAARLIAAAARRRPAAFVRSNGCEPWDRSP